MPFRRACLAILIVAAVAPSALAQAPGETASAASEFDACRQRRSELYAHATAQADIHERTRILQSMPECTRPPALAAVGAPAAPTAGALVYSPSAPEAPTPNAADTATASITMAPLTTIFVAALGGFALDARGEAAIAPHVGLGTTVAYASLPDLFSSDVMFSFFMVAPQITYYVDRFSGLHAGGAVVYAYGHNTAGTGFLGGEVSEDDTSMLGAHAFIGYKWIRRNGFTATAQLGAAVLRVSESGETEVAPAGGMYVGWSL